MSAINSNLFRIALVTFCVALALGPPSTAETTADELPTISTIEITGNTRTDEIVIRDALDLCEGDPFDEDAFDDYWDRVEDLGFFSFVDMDYGENDEGGIVLSIRVEEERTARVAPLMRYDRRHKYALGASWRDINLRGKAEQLGAEAIWYRAHGYRVEWIRPRAFGLSPLSVSVSGDWLEAPFVYRPTRFTRSSRGGSARWDFDDRLYVEASLRHRHFEQHDGYVGPLPDRGAGPGPVVAHPADRTQHLILGAAIGYDSRDSAYFPLRGACGRVEVRRLDGRSSPSATIGTADLRAFLPLPWGHTIGARAWGRIVDAPLPLEDRLFWGGEETIRGYDYAGLEGEEGWLLSTEYRWPLFLMPISPRGHIIALGLHAFADAGDAWHEDADPHRRLHSWGAGVNVSISSLQLRFEAARTEDGDTVFQFHDHFNF